MTIRWHFSDSPLVSVLALEIDDVHYTREEVERIVAAHSSGVGSEISVSPAQMACRAVEEGTVCGRRTYRGRRYCPKHWQRFMRHGDPVLKLRPWDKKKEKVV